MSESKTDDVTGTLIEVFDYEYQSLKAERDAAIADLERFVELHNQAQHERNEAWDERDKWRRRARTWKAFAKIVYEERLESVRWDPYA
jgi:hypothetical protein